MSSKIRITCLFICLLATLFVIPPDSTAQLPELDATSLSPICDLEVTVEEITPTCEGGDVCLNIQNGTPPYTFILNGQEDNPNPNNSLDICFPGLPPNIYTLAVTDAEGCSATITFEVYSSEILEAVVENVSCHGANDGSLFPIILIDIAPIYFSWEGPNGFTSDEELIDNLEPGTYSVSATTTGDVCVGIGSWTITEPEPINIDIVVTTQACGPPDACVYVNGGTPPYYLWVLTALPNVLSNSMSGTLPPNVDLDPNQGVPVPPNTSPTQPAFCAEDVPNGTYYVLVVDANLCYAWEVVTIDSPSTGFTRTVTTENISCNGEQDGSICFTIDGGTAPYVTSLSPNTGSAGITGPEGCFDNLAPGVYTLTTTDGTGCAFSETIYIHEPEPLSAEFYITSPECAGQVDGCVKVMGGTMPFHITIWHWPDPSSDVLPDVTIDNNGNAQIENSTQLDDIIFQGDPVAPYIRCADDIPPGYYLLLVVDANGCYELLPIHIPDTDGLEASFEITSAPCEEEVDGCLTVSGGEMPYQIYVWDHPGPNTDPTNLQVIFNDDGVPMIANTTANADWALLPVSNTSNTYCAEDIPPGHYIVLVVDANHCYILLHVHIPEGGNGPEASFEITSDPCEEEVDGCLTITGGTPPYDLYVWIWNSPLTVIPTVEFDSDGNPYIDGADPTDDLHFDNTAADPLVRCAEDIPPGYYLVLVVDANGCYDLLPVLIPEAGSLGLNFEKADVSCAGGSDGAIKVEIAGGEPPYTVVVNGTNTTTIDGHIFTLEDLPAGIYEITVYDNNQCSGSITISISEPAPIELNLEFDQYGEFACVDPTGGTPPYQYRWFDLGSNAVISNEACVYGLLEGVYLIRVRDSEGCTAEDILFIDEAPCLGGEASVDPEVINSGESTVFTLSDWSGLELQWQFKTDITPWLNIPGATTAVFETPPIHSGSDKTILVRAEVICNNGDVVYSSVAEFKVLGNNFLQPVAAIIEDTNLFNPAFRAAELSAIASTTNLDAPAIRVFPTLATDKVTIEFEKGSSGVAEIYLINTHGQILMSKEVDEPYRGNQEVLEVGHLPNGSYFIRTIIDDKVNTARVIINR